MIKPLSGIFSRREALKAFGLSAASLGLATLGAARASAAERKAEAAAEPAEPPAPAGPYTLPELGYPFEALEPAIDAQTMQIHHSKHHKTYIDNANRALAAYPEFGRMEPEELLRSINRVPGSIAIAVRNNVGGHANHSLFWDVLTPGGPKEPKGGLGGRIKSDFGNRDTFFREMGEAAAGRFGSGWVWLAVYNKKLFVVSTANQDSPLMDGYTPLLGIDVWEHAYYLKYQNRRSEYFGAVMSVVNWDKVGARYEAAIKA
ncbi:MAG: superoxide dismutase [Opitutaceae bacterium]